MEPEQHEHKFTGVFIPAYILENTKISPFERFLWAEISALAGRGECFASNAYLAKKMNATPNGISNAISKLKKEGLIVQTRFDGRIRGLKTIEQENPKAENAENKENSKKQSV